MSRRIYDRREGRKSSRFIDRTGMIAHRLLYLEWLGKWHGQHYWKTLCECGNTFETIWKVADVRSCGCLQRENRKAHGWETQRTDGKWGLWNEARLRLDDGRVMTVSQMAEQVGVHKRVMAKRIQQWPQHRWFEPPHATGMRPARIVKREWHRRPQPWAAATTRMLNEDGRAYRKTKPALAEPPAAGPGQDGSPAASAPDAAVETPER